MNILYYLLAAVIAYLFGSISFSIIVTYFFTKQDIRSHGSGNAGGSNVVRTVGIAAGLFVILLDVLKCVAPVLIVKYLIPGGDSPTMLCLAGLFCVIGHMYPVFFGFKGGKGVASAAGMVLVVNIWAFIAVILTFLIVIIITRYISVGSICAATVYPITMGILFWNTSEFIPVVILAVATGLLIISKHGDNMVRLKNHKENKISLKNRTK